MKRAVLIAVVLLIVVGAVVLVKSKKAALEAESVPAVKSIVVKSVKPEKRVVEQSRLYIGRYRSLDHPKISSKISGYIEKIEVCEAEPVKKGDPLFRIDDKEIRESITAQLASVHAVEISIKSLKSSLEALKSDYLHAKDVYDRNMALFEAGALAKEKLDFSRVAMELKRNKYETAEWSIKAKEKELEAAKAQLASKRNLLRYAIVRAPLDGSVGKIYLREGDLAAPGKPVMDILGEKKVVEFSFAPDTKSLLEPGAEVRIGTTEATIEKILPVSDRGLMVARVALEKPLDAAENQNVALRVILKRKEGIAVSTEALLYRGDSTYLFEYVDGKFLPRKVEVEVSDGRFAIVSPAPKAPVAVGSDDKLSRLFVVKSVKAAEDG